MISGFSGELSTPKSDESKTPKRTKSQIEKEIALLTNSENILGFRLEKQLYRIVHGLICFLLP